MTSYFSSITSSSAISNLGTRLNSLRRAITLGDEADDPENEDCSHISNVLRAYYTEKGRPYPSWLPQDPKAPAPPPSRAIATSQLQQGSYGPATSASTPGRGGGLGDLWGDSGAPELVGTQTGSLRRGRATPGNAGAPLSTIASAPAGPGASPSAHPAGARPLPSQRAASSYQPAARPPPLERAASAQDRLRARLHGGRSPSPAQMGDSGPGSPYYAGGAGPNARKPVGGRR